MHKFSKIKIIILILVAVIITTGGFRCKWISPKQQALLEPVELTWWGVFDDSQNFTEVINDYKQLHPHITINYRKLRAEEFENELLDALAEDRGPDIFSIQNTWVTKYLAKIEPLPAKTTIAYEITQKSLGIKEETLVEIRDNISITPPQLKNEYLDVVYEDVVRDNKIYGLPLSVDTLGLFFNRDLLNNAGIPLPPTNWLTLQENVKKLTYQDQSGNLIQSGVALGTADNVENFADILSILMQQNGAEMNQDNRVTFGLIPSSFPDRTYNPGPEAVRFYTDFANPSKEVYTWNETFSNSIDAFSEGRVAMIFGYSYHIPYLEAKRQGKLNYGVTKMPQIEGRPEINAASYWLQTVSKKSKHVNEAWDFIQFISKEKEVKKYLDKTLKPTALRSLIAEQLTNDNLKVFADQLLTSKSWYKGNDASVVESAFKELIDSMKTEASLEDLINIAARKIQQTL
ncbi:MAG: extracellular solute-binding protein [Patescibacteria group bacterium]|jgi:multiple sugar transport system substrate-binding protein